MKRIIILTVSVLVIASVGVISVLLINQSVINNNSIGENNETAIKSDKDVREVLWQQLSSEQKEQIIDGWESGSVARVTLTGAMMVGVSDKSYEGKEVYLIDYPIKSQGSTNNLLVYADATTLKYIGIGPND